MIARWRIRERGREGESEERERVGFLLYLMLDCDKGFRFILLQVNVLNINPAWLNQHSQRQRMSRGFH